MKDFIALSFFIGCIFCQSSGLYVYGIGERVDTIDPISIALGNSSFFSGNSKNINNDSPSSVWRSALTRLSIHSGLDYYDVNDYSNQFRQSLTSFSIYFPVSNKKVLGFGLQPVFRINDLQVIDEKYSFIGSDKSVTNKPIAYKNNYSINGGISQAFLVYSWQLNPKFSFGIKYSLLFGNQIISDELYTYDVLIDTSNSNYLIIDEVAIDTETLLVLASNQTLTEISRNKKFKGSSITLEGRYIYNKHELVLNALIHNKNNIEITTEQNINNFISSSTSQIRSESLSYNFGFGYKSKISNNTGLLFEFHKSPSFNIPSSISIFNVSPPGEDSFHLGYFYRFPNSRIGFWNNMIFRLGSYYKNKFFADDLQLFDFGFTLGLGVEYINNTQSIDIALRFGNKESLSFLGEIENYVSLHIGLTTGEKWFMKRRRK